MSTYADRLLEDEATSGKIWIEKWRKGHTLNPWIITRWHNLPLAFPSFFLSQFEFSVICNWMKFISLFQELVWRDSNTRWCLTYRVTETNVEWEICQWGKGICEGFTSWRTWMKRIWRAREGPHWIFLLLVLYLPETFWSLLCIFILRWFFNALFSSGFFAWMASHHALQLFNQWP